MPIIVRDPCGNPIPIPLTIPDLTPPAMKLPDLLKLLANLLGVTLPIPEMPTPCPYLKAKTK